MPQKHGRRVEYPQRHRSRVLGAIVHHGQRAAEQNRGDADVHADEPDQLVHRRTRQP